MDGRRFVRITLRASVRAGVGVAAILLLAPAPVNPAGQQSVPNPMNPRQGSPFDPANSPDPLFVDRQLRALNAERQKSMVSDTEKLLRLAREVNSEIGTGNPDIELRKISDIEKLARNVRQKMSSSLVSGPAYHDPIPPPFR
jgi:hypothetical protein